MCLAIPSKIIGIDGDMAMIDVDGVRRQASLLLLEAPQVGDWVIVHAGFAIHKIDEAAAQESLRILKETAAAVESAMGRPIKPAAPDDDA
jgi:hydrogenase expression/formation protein HypC